MSLISLENFSCSTNATDYSSLNYNITTNPIFLSNFGKNCFGGSGGVAPTWLTRLFQGVYPIMYLGARCYVPPAQTEIGFISFLSGPINNPGSTQIGCQFNVDGTISIFQSATMESAFGEDYVNIGPILQSTTTSVYVPGVSFYFEMYASCSSTTGQIQININETPAIALFNQDTNPTGRGFFKGWAVYEGGTALNAGTSPYVTDVYICDNTGSNWNTYQGDVNIQTLFPIANDTIQFTPTGGTNWQNVSRVPPVPNSDFNTSNTANTSDTFTCNGLSTNTSDVLGAVARSMANGPAGGLHTFQQLVQSNVNVATSNNQVLTTGFVYYDSVFNNDPSTGNIWTVDSMNQVVIGYELIT